MSLTTTRCAGRVADAFDIKDTLVGALGRFRKPLKPRCRELIVEADRAVGPVSGEGAGPTGLPYAQPHYAMVRRIEEGRIRSGVEFMDTVAVETALFGKSLVPA